MRNTNYKTFKRYLEENTHVKLRDIVNKSITDSRINENIKNYLCLLIYEQRQPIGVILNSIVKYQETLYEGKENSEMLSDIEFQEAIGNIANALFAEFLKHIFNVDVDVR
jgi:hypothetical protein